MSLNYICPGCGTSLGYEGLCWKCKSEQERKAALAWTPEQIGEKQKNLIQNIQRLAEMEDPEFTDFWQLLSYHDAITPEIQRVALAAEVFWPCEIYYHAPADVRDGLIHALLSAEYSSAASNLMSCLAMQGDDKAMETLLELERNPRPWRKGLYVDPSSYAQIGGWTFNKEGQKIQLNFDTCYPMVKGTTSEKSPVRIGRAREDTCPHCGGRMVDMLVLDGRDERLKFLGLDGILTATCCPNCVGFLKGPAFNSFTLDGGVEVFPSELFDGAEKTDCYVSPEDYKALTENPFVLGEAPVPLFYGAACQDVNTVGGFANWVQDAEYTTCPHCGKPMKYLAQIQWDTVLTVRRARSMWNSARTAISCPCSTSRPKKVAQYEKRNTSRYLRKEASTMCEHCRNIQTWRKFDAPKDYLACIAYIQQLVSEGEFELMQEESTCPLEKVKTEDGWADEIMAHMIRCKHCGQIFTCVVNTWRGSEHFRKGKG